MKVNTFLIGVQKSGTTTFWNWINQHPDIYGPETMKDFHFFSNQKWRNKEYDYLHSFYSGYKNEKVILQGGVNYYFEPEFINRHLTYQPNGKYLIILRNPIERAWSAYQYLTKLGNEERSFRVALENEINKENLPQDRHMFAYLEHGLYAKFLKQLFAHIPKEKILILFYEELFKDKNRYLKKTFEFLNVNPLIEIDTSVTKNKTGQARYPQLNKAIFSNKGLVGKFKKLIPIQKAIPLKYRIQFGDFIRDFNTNNNKTKAVLDQNDRNFLKSYFFSPNQELEEVLGKDLSSIWE